MRKAKDNKDIEEAKDRTSSSESEDMISQNEVKESSENTEDTYKRKSAEDRIGIFFGVLLILAAAYMLIVSFSFFSHGAADQSLVERHSLSYVAGEAPRVENAGGPLGAYLSSHLISGWLGIGTFIFIYYITMIALMLMKVVRVRIWSLTLKCLLSAITLSMAIGFATQWTPSSMFWGGCHGHYINSFLIETTSVWGALVVNLLLISMTFLLFYNDLAKRYSRYRRMYDRRRQIKEEERREAFLAKRRQKEEEARKAMEAKKRETISHNSIYNQVKVETPKPAQSPKVEPELRNTTNTVENIDGSPKAIDETKSEDESPALIINETGPIEEAEPDKNEVDRFDPTAELSKYRFPSLDLLHEVKVKNVSVDLEEQEENKERITKTLNDYGIEISHIEATVGPTITLYEIIPAKGVTIARIKRLEDDIALSLAALGIRIIAPIPGKGTIGIEVPNKEPQTVPIRSILASKAYQESKMDLPMAIGSTISNEVFIADLCKMPHVLVAGATGQGKSVGLNTIIASLIYKKHPSELKFVLIDPKMVEFSLYSKLERHYLAKMEGEEEAIITDPRKVVTVLNSLCVEMDNRYQLLKQAGDRNIKDYNNRFMNRRLNPEKGHRYLPYIVLIVDEFADLIMTAGKEVETPIARLAQKARAVGIHLILATQRPSTNVITGIIKANFPGRVAFRVTQMVDSRTILDRSGAQQLIGKGDLLFSRDGEISRVQCAFISTEEVEAICNAIDDQVGFERAYILPEYIPESEGGEISGATFGDRDPLFEEAARAIVTSGVASTSSLQRRYSIGYNRAGKIMDQMEAAGIVGPSQGGKPRQVLVDIVTLESKL